MEKDRTIIEIPPSTEAYKTIRGQIEHYDNGINQRVIWLSIGQSFFFGVYATLVSIKAPTPDLLEKQKLFATVLPFAALLTAICTFFDVVATLGYMKKLRRYYEQATKNITTDSIYPPVFGRPIDRIFQHISPALIPLIFIFTWIYLLVHIYQMV